MTALPGGSRVIVDTSFVRSSPPDGSTFRALVGSGFRLVLIDNMAFELCSTSNQAQWPATQMKLIASHEAVECWHHTGPMLLTESQRGQPYGSPFHEETTRAFRQVLSGVKAYIPDNLAVLTREEQDVREDLAVPALFRDLNRFACQLSRFEPYVRAKPIAEIDAPCYQLVNNPENIQHFLELEGFPLDRLDETWVAWHHAKSFLAILCDYMRQGKPSFESLPKEAHKRWINRKHDLDYLVSLAYADAIATNETAGEMAHYRRWMYGDTKRCIAVADARIPGTTSPTPRPMPDRTGSQSS